MVDLRLIDSKLGLYIKINVNKRQNKFEVHISKNVAKMAILWPKIGQRHFGVRASHGHNLAIFHQILTNEHTKMTSSLRRIEWNQILSSISLFYILGFWLHFCSEASHGQCCTYGLKTTLKLLAIMASSYLKIVFLQKSGLNPPPPPPPPLKKSIKDSELFPTNIYEVFRLDRSVKTHPINPNNPSKFRKNGGGVFIGIRRDLDIVSIKLEIQCAGEILGVTLTFNDGRKLILCSYYRVGTLGVENNDAFRDFIKKARYRRGIKGIVLAGHLNMPKIDWEIFSSTENIDRLFLDSLTNLELEQLINVPPIHVDRGNILDIILTDKPALISDFTVSDKNLPCKFDHFSVSFNINSEFKRIKVPKREVHNYKRADWNALNSSINFTDWDIELQGHVQVAWCSFKRIGISTIVV